MTARRKSHVIPSPQRLASWGGLGRGLRGSCGIILLILLLLPTPTFAKTATLGTFGTWKTYAYDEGGQTVCYMVTTKTMKSSGPKKRAPAYLMITHRPIEASTDVVSYDAGALLDAKHDVILHVANTRFDFFSVRDTAWTRDALLDHKITAAIRHAATAQITAFPAQKHAPPIKDLFDLSGADPAYHAISKACGLLPPAKKHPAAKPQHPRQTGRHPPPAQG